MVTKPRAWGVKAPAAEPGTDTKLKVLILVKKGCDDLARAVKMELEQFGIAYGCVPLKSSTGCGAASSIVRTCPESGYGAIIVISGDSVHEAHMLTRASVVPMCLVLNTGGRSAKHWLRSMSDLIGVEVGSGIPVFLSGDPHDDLTAAGNAALHAAKCLALHDQKLRKRIYMLIVEGSPASI
ncbi:MAG: hypothetical protein KBC38_00365 [Candidatus Pacebacteria bacterium]|nr:hypothetical protein [Candidatus Paceibacterota bacterium]MBP9840450.1 hypothetical protein [Candidatus Paceibacterota bacterium]